MKPSTKFLFIAGVALLLTVLAATLSPAQHIHTRSSGTSLPATCNVWDEFDNTSTGALSLCSAPNTWFTLSGAAGTGTINSGTTNQLGYYAANGTTISGLNLGTNLSITSGTLNATGGSGSYAYSVLAAPPGTSSFTNTNFQAGTTLAASGTPNVLFMTIPYDATLNWQVAKYNTALPSTPWRYATFISAFQSGGSLASTTTGGLYAYDGTKLWGVESFNQATATEELRVEHITNVTTDGSTVYGATASTWGPIIKAGVYIGICYDGTNIYAEESLDGVNWTSIYEDTSGYLTPTSVAFGGVNVSTSANVQYLSVKGFSVATVSSCP